MRVFQMLLVLLPLGGIVLLGGCSKTNLIGGAATVTITNCVVQIAAPHDTTHPKYPYMSIFSSQANKISVTSPDDSYLIKFPQESPFGKDLKIEPGPPNISGITSGAWIHAFFLGDHGYTFDVYDVTKSIKCPDPIVHVTR